MMLKKIALATALFATVSGLSASALAAPSAEVTLQGIITNTTCDVTVNGGKSVLNVGVFKSSEFTANTMTTQTVDMPVTLDNCAAPGDSTAGDLIIQGLTSLGNNDQNIFVNSDNETVGFMIEDETSAVVTNGTGPTLPAALATGDTATYTFKVGMATTEASAAAGSYSAPILVAYIVE